MQIEYSNKPLLSAQMKSHCYLRIARVDQKNHSGFTFYFTTNMGEKFATKSCVSAKANDPKNWHRINQRAEQLIKELKNDGRDLKFLVYMPKTMEQCISLHKENKQKYSPRKTKTELGNNAGNLVNVFDDLRIFKAALRNVNKVRGVDYLKAMSNEFKIIVDEIVDEEHKLNAAQLEKDRKAANLLVMMREAGISIDDLAKPSVKRQASTLSSQGHPQERIKSYQCLIDGRHINFTCQDKIPEQVRHYLNENNKRLEDLMVA